MGLAQVHLGSQYVIISCSPATTTFQVLGLGFTVAFFWGSGVISRVSSLVSLRYKPKCMRPCRHVRGAGQAAGAGGARGAARGQRPVLHPGLHARAGFLWPGRRPAPPHFRGCLCRAHALPLGAPAGARLHSVCAHCAIHLAGMHRVYAGHARKSFDRSSGDSMMRLCLQKRAEVVVPDLRMLAFPACAALSLLKQRAPLMVH